MSDRTITGSLGAATSGPAVIVNGWGFVRLSGTFSATVKVEARRGSSGTWVPVSLTGSGSPTSMTEPVRTTFFEPEDGVDYRVTCSAYTSGTIDYALGPCP